MDCESEIDDPKACETPEKVRRCVVQSKKFGKHRKQRFRSEWLQQAEYKHWLAPERGDDYRAKCLWCNTSFTAELSVVNKHKDSKSHVNAKYSVGYGSSQRTLFQCKVTPSTSSTVEQLFKEDVKIAEIRTSAFLAEHNVSFRCVDHLVQRDKAVFHDSKIANAMKLGRTKATSIVKNVIGQSHSEELARVLSATRFSLIIDEGTDIGSIKTLCVCVRYFDTFEGKIVTRFWNLVQTFSGADPKAAFEGATAQRLFDGLMKSLTVAAVPTSNIVGFGSDGCSVMMGRNNSVSQKLEALIPGVVIVKCICHSLHLCASEACKCLPRFIEDLARNIYNIFKNSSKRQAGLQEFQEFCNVDPHKILKPSQTRWLSLLSVVQRIIEQWEPLKLFFIHLNATQDRVLAMEQILTSMNDPQSKLYYFFLDWVLPKFVNLNELFQSERSLVTVLHQKITLVYMELLCVYVERHYVMQTNLDKINPDPSENSALPLVPLQNMYLGIKVMQEMSRPEIASRKDLLKEVRTRCRDFIVEGCKQLRQRYDFSSSSVFSLMSGLHPSTALSNSETRPQTLMPLARLVPCVVSPQDAVLLQKIDDQWRKLVLMRFPELTGKEEPDLFWAKILSYSDIDGANELKELAKFALDVLVLPHSSASCERVFSKVSAVKTKSRNKIMTNTLNGLLLSAQCASTQGGCAVFKITDDMLSRMSREMYAPSHTAPSKEDTDEDIVFEEEL